MQCELMGQSCRVRHPIWRGKLGRRRSGELFIFAIRRKTRRRSLICNKPLLFQESHQDITMLMSIGGGTWFGVLSPLLTSGKKNVSGTLTKRLGLGHMTVQTPS